MGLWFALGARQASAFARLFSVFCLHHVAQDSAKNAIRNSPVDEGIDLEDTGAFKKENVRIGERLGYGVIFCG